MGVGLMIVNIVTMINMYSVIETMWLEIQQVKETNISLYQFIQEHIEMTLIKENKGVRKEDSR